MKNYDHIAIASLFSGIGGLELGVSKALPGAETLWQVEKDAFARRVLAKHWPDAERFEDVSEVGGRELGGADVVMGGWPCQDASHANVGGRGLEGERTGLWWEFARIVREVRPRYVVAENVANINRRGLEKVLLSLAQIGYMRSEWDIISAASVGAAHGRDRCFIIAVRDRDIPYPDRARQQKQRGPVTAATKYSPSECSRRWSTLPQLGRTAAGFPGRVDRLRCLGNAVCPPVAYVVGKRLATIIDREEEADGLRR